MKIKGSLFEVFILNLINDLKKLLSEKTCADSVVRRKQKALIRSFLSDQKGADLLDEQLFHAVSIA